MCGRRAKGTKIFFFFLKARNKQINKTKVIKMRKEDADKQKQTWNKNGRDV